MLSFLKKEEEPQDGMAKGDIIFIIVLLVAGLGIYFYSTTVKQKSTDIFDKCTSLYNSQEYAKATLCFDEEATNVHYKTDSLDKVLYEYTTKLYEIESAEREVFKTIEKLNESKNYKLVVKMTDKLPDRIHFLTDEQLSKLKQWAKESREAIVAEVDSVIVDSTKIDSTNSVKTK